MKQPKLGSESSSLHHQYVIQIRIPFDDVFSSLADHHRQLHSRIAFSKRPQHRCGEQHIADVAKLDDENVIHSRKPCGLHHWINDTPSHPHHFLGSNLDLFSI